MKKKHFKSTAQLDLESRELAAWFDREWSNLDHGTELAKAVFDRDDLALAKAASPDLEIAKADCAAIRAEFGEKLNDRALKDLLPAFRVRKVMSEWVERYTAIANDERRARRVNAIIANALPSHGPYSVRQ